MIHITFIIYCFFWHPSCGNVDFSPALLEKSENNQRRKVNPNHWYGRSTERTILSSTAQIGHKHEETSCLQAKFVPLCKDIITQLAAGTYAFLSGGRCKSMDLKIT